MAPRLARQWEAWTLWELRCCWLKHNSLPENKINKNSHTRYFWMSHTAAALPGQRPDAKLSKPKVFSWKVGGGDRNREGTVWWTKKCRCWCSVWAGIVSDGAGQTHYMLSLNDTPLTTFHRSLTRESTLRMSVCSAPPLIPPVVQGHCPHCFAPPQPTASNWAGHLSFKWEPYGGPKDTVLWEAVGVVIILAVL